MELGMDSTSASNPSVIAFVRAFSHSRSLQVVTGNWVEHCRNEAVPLVKPILVCQVQFTDWTRDDRLRQPVFSGSAKTRMRSRWFGRKQSCISENSWCCPTRRSTAFAQSKAVGVVGTTSRKTLLRSGKGTVGHKRPSVLCRAAATSEQG
jgi:hypothetical protein